MLRMKVKAVGIDRDTMLPVVILTDDAEESYVPLVIGPAEANAIAVVLENVEITRPLTHDLLLSTVLALGAKVDKVVVTDLTEDAISSSTDGGLTARVPAPLSAGDSAAAFAATISSIAAKAGSGLELTFAIDT